MGWWWKPDPQTPVLKPSEPSPDLVPTSSQPPASVRDVIDKPTAITSREAQCAQPRTLSREEQADAELKAFLAELESSTKSPEEQHASVNAADASTPTKRSIYPTTMSCREAFDAAFYCQSLGGQFNNVYRYGNLRSCSEHWSDFWFCMRIKSYGDTEKAKLVEERYRDKERKYREGPSSEDVWEERRLGEELNNAFMKNPDQVNVPGLPKRKRLIEQLS